MVRGDRNIAADHLVEPKLKFGFCDHFESLNNIFKVR